MKTETRRTMLCRFLCRLVLAALAGTAAASIVRAAEPLTLDEIKTRLRKQRENINSLYIEVKREEKPLVDLEVLLSLRGFSNKILLSNEEEHFAFKGEKRYSRELWPPDTKYLRPMGRAPKLPANASELEREQHKRRLDDHKELKQRMARAERMGSKIGLAEGPTPDATKAYNGRTQWMRDVHRDGTVWYTITHAGRLGHWFQPAPYLVAVGLTFPDPIEKEEALHEARRMVDLLELLQRWPHEVSSKTEEIDGGRCAVLTGTIQFPITVGEVSQTFEISSKLWLDLDHGLAIRQGERQTMGTLTRMVNSDFQEVLPGLWLPKKCQMQVFAPPDAPEELKGRPVMIEHLTLTKCVVNEVPDDLFDMAPKPGDEVLDLRDPKFRGP